MQLKELQNRVPAQYELVHLGKGESNALASKVKNVGLYGRFVDLESVFIDIISSILTIHGRSTKTFVGFYILVVSSSTHIL